MKLPCIALLAIILAGCNSTDASGAGYTRRANANREPPPRAETETPVQAADRVASSNALDRRIVNLSAKDEFVPPQLLENAAPNYPEAAREQRISGTVVAAIIIDAQGQVSDATIISSPNPIFNGPALDAVRRWKFTPGLKNGSPVSVSYRVPIEFRL